MSESSKVPPTPKLGSISLPDDNDNTKIFGGTRKRLSSLFGKTSVKTPNIGIPRSVTPAPVPVSRYEPPHPGGYRPRSSSLTNKPHVLDQISQSTSSRSYPIYHSRCPSPAPARGGSSKVRQYPAAHMSQSATYASRATAVRPIVLPGKHEGPDTPKYMKAKVKEVALKEESIVLSWPLVPYGERRHLKYPLLYYDVAFDPRDVDNVKDNRATHFLALPQEDRELPVSTHCKITEIVVECPHVGSLVVERPEGLRCIDVFYAIYCKYQKKPRSHEMPTDRAKYQRAFEQRCKDCPGLAEYNRTKIGFLRVDLLRGKRIFDGLKRSSGRWELVIHE
ncbi:Metallo-beta-lactamase protein [Mycena venus]|uniref:Metallo-beta-lactamase protein n=1 Tax=Mycena venus TaxID=2733690 RepID=A0A8H7D731_9AGAR|nr:Metallo-beta-lactamase protein [Mycena venus]